MTGRGNRLSIFVLLLTFGVVAGVRAEADRQTQPSRGDSTAVKNPKAAMLRSLLVPGWGQFYNGQWLKGVLIAGAEIGLTANAVVLNQWAQQTTDEVERFYYQDSRNLSYWLLAGTVLFSVVDAFVDAHLYHFDESPDLSLLVVSQEERFTSLIDRSCRLRWSLPLP